MLNGRDCAITIKTDGLETDIPYSEETVRGAVSILEERAAIEGDGLRRALAAPAGVTGCVAAPLTVGTAPLLLLLALGGGESEAESSGGARRLGLRLAPMEDADGFDLIQRRGGDSVLYEGCKVEGFELRIERGEAIRLRLDVWGEGAPRAWPGGGAPASAGARRYHGDAATFRVNGKEQENIYALTIESRKKGSARTTLRLHRALGEGADFPETIEELEATALLDGGRGGSGAIRLTLKRLARIADETKVDAADAVIGPLRYYVAGAVTAEARGAGGGEI